MLAMPSRGSDIDKSFSVGDLLASCLIAVWKVLVSLAPDEIDRLQPEERSYVTILILTFLTDWNLSNMLQSARTP